MHEVDQGATPPNPQYREDLDSVPKNHAIRFLDLVFNGFTRGFAEFRHLSAGKRPKVVGNPHFIPLPLDYDRVADQLLGGPEEKAIMVGPAPRYRIPRGGKAGKDCDIIQSSCVWTDISYSRMKGGIIEAIQLIQDFPLRPSIVVNSGYSRQVYFVFSAPLSDGKLINWSKLIRGLSLALNGTAVNNPSRVLYLPGSFNMEEPEHPEPCLLDEDHSSWLRYSTEEVERAIQMACEIKPERIEGVHSSKGRSRITVASLQDRGVIPNVIDAIVTGKCTTNEDAHFYKKLDHHERDIWITTSLLERGFGRDEIKDIFRSNPRGCGNKWATGSKGEDYLEFTLRTAEALRGRNGISKLESSEDYHSDFISKLPSGYKLEEDGSLWLDPTNEDNSKKSKRVKVANNFLGIAQIQEDIDTGQIHVVIEYKYLGQIRRKTITRTQMADAKQLVTSLAGEGAPVTSNNARYVTSYLAAYEHCFGHALPRKKTTSKFGRGRAGGTFIFPGLTPDVEFSPAGIGDASLLRAYSSRQGSLPGWLDAMRQVAGERLMIPQVAILSALVPPLQNRLQIPNFILDISGSSSTGKSTSLKLAASVYGRPQEPDSLILQWMNTRAALEQVAGMCSELPIFLDDAQHCQDELKRSVIYMIANGRGKGRASGRGRGISETPTWHTVALSTSEEPLHESSRHEGARGRILPLGGNAAPFPPGSGEFVQALERSVALNHGHAGEAYLRHLNEISGANWAEWQRRFYFTRAGLLHSSSSNLAGRVSGYIAALQLAGEIACPLLGLTFKPDAISAWLMLHLDEQQNNQNKVLIALRALADFYVKNIGHFAGDGCYTSGNRLAIHGASKRDKYVGFLRSTVDSALRPYKWSQTFILNMMAEAGVLYATEEDRHTKKVSVEGVKHRMVCVKWTALLPEDISNMGN
jgi:hypothetical protein